MSLPRQRATVKPSSVSLHMQPSAPALNGSVGAAPLGTIGRCSSPASQCGTEDAQKSANRLIERFALQSAARELLPGEGVAKCLRAPVPGSLVNVLYVPEHQKAQYSGLQICKSVWMCPVCAAKVSERRRVELQETISAWLALAGARRTLLVTFTLSHTLGDDLARVLALLKKARTYLVSGKAAKAFKQKYAIAGMVRALEVTHSFDNGFHPHLHVLYFLAEDVSIISFTNELKARWVAAVAAAGGSASLEHGCDVRFSDADVANYVAKFGRVSSWTPAHELTKAVVKRGRGASRSPAELLADYLFADDKQAGALWQVYARAFKGERQLHYSHGLRALLGLGKEKTDDELAVEHDDLAVLLAALTPGAWRVVVANDARAELLNVACSGDADAVRVFLVSLGALSRVA